MTRLFLTSYQKSGTHQIMPALGIEQDVIDRSRNELLDLPKRYGRSGTLDTKGIETTCKGLADFYDKAFGHISYLPVYAQALQLKEDTKVLFNVRDPRDTVIASYFSASKGKWPNLHIEEYGCNIADLEDPISELIQVAAVRWLKWIGWIQHDFVKIVHYEDLRLNGAETMQEIAEWLLPYRIDVDECVARLSPRPKNPTFRRGVPGEWRTGMTDKQKALANKLLSDVIKLLGYEI